MSSIKVTIEGHVFKKFVRSDYGSELRIVLIDEDDCFTVFEKLNSDKIDEPRAEPLIGFCKKCPDNTNFILCYEFEASRDHWREQAERIVKERDGLQERIDRVVQTITPFAKQTFGCRSGNYAWMVDVLTGKDTE